MFSRQQNVSSDIKNAHRRTPLSHRGGGEQLPGPQQQASGYLLEGCSTARLLHPLNSRLTVSKNSKNDSNFHSAGTASTGGQSSGKADVAGSGALGAYSAGTFCEQAGNSVKTCFQPAVHVISATNTSNYSYQLLNCHFPGLFSRERQTEAAEACSGEQVPCGASLAEVLQRAKMLPCQGRGPLLPVPPCAPLAPSQAPRGTGTPFLEPSSSCGALCSRIPGAGAEPQTRNPPCQPFTSGKREYWASLVRDFTRLPGFLYSHGHFCLAYHSLASVQPSTSVAKGHKFLQEGDRNCLLHKSNFPHTCLLALKVPK